jgi:acetylornithine deacetylase/succinyl-diaminopimelate desuccinylase-like protein
MHSPGNSDRLNDEQLNILSELVNIPSYYHQDPYGKERECNENEIMSYIESQLSDESSLTVVSPQLRDGRRNVIVQKGNGTEFVLWLTGHVDTVRLDRAKTENRSMKFQIQGDRMTGPGVGDMKMGIAGMIDVLKRVDVPNWMTVIAAFMPDEELESMGALGVIELQKEGKIPPPDLIFSPEIPTAATLLREEEVPITIARRGHAKLKGQIIVPKGHGAQGSAVPNAIKIFSHLYQELERKFNWYNKKIGNQLLLGGEDFEPRFVTSREDKSLSVPDTVTYQLSRMITPKTTPQHALELLKDAHNEFIKRQEKKFKTKIFSTLQLRPETEATSYPAYALPVPILNLESQDERIKYANTLGRIVDDVYSSDQRKHAFSGGKSTSDANLFVQQGWTVYECAGNAGGEHTTKEWASSKGALRTIQIMEELMSGKHFNNT